MCGRYSLAQGYDQIISGVAADWFDVADDSWEFVPRYNIAPTNMVPVIAMQDDQRMLSNMRWGLIPSWAKDSKIGYRMINARSETAATTNAFRSAYKRRRCLVLSDGFYEWRGPKGKREPLRFTMKDGDMFAFAGLWEVWKDREVPDDKPVRTFTILTTTPNELIASIHDRMPVILNEEAQRLWMDHSSDETRPLRELLKPFPAGSMTGYDVSPSVNNVRNEGPELNVPV